MIAYLMSSSELFYCGTNIGGRAVHKAVISHLTREFESAEHWSFMNHFRRETEKLLFGMLLAFWDLIVF